MAKGCKRPFSGERRERVVLANRWSAHTHPNTNGMKRSERLPARCTFRGMPPPGRPLGGMGLPMRQTIRHGRRSNQSGPLPSTHRITYNAFDKHGRAWRPAAAGHGQLQRRKARRHHEAGAAACLRGCSGGLRPGAWR